MSCGFSVQKFSFENQTASLSSTTLFTPTTDGDFFIGIAGDVVGHDSGGDPSSISGAFGWTGNDGTYKSILDIANNYGSSPPFSWPTAYQQTVFPIHAVAGQPITLETTWSPVGTPVGSQYYDLYITVIGG